MADQIATASKKRLKNKIGCASQESMLALEKAIKIQLCLQ